MHLEEMATFLKCEQKTDISLIELKKFLNNFIQKKSSPEVVSINFNNFSKFLLSPKWNSVYCPCKTSLY